MTKYDKEVDSSTPEYDQAIEPLEEATHPVQPPRDTPPDSPGEVPRDDGSDPKDDELQVS